MDLSEISTESLVHEVQRRLECLNKPERRLILIGARGPWLARLCTPGDLLARLNVAAVPMGQGSPAAPDASPPRAPVQARPARARARRAP